MATLLFDVEPTRKERKFSIKGKNGFITMRRQLEYRVVLRWSDGSTDFSEVSEAEIVAADGLPKVYRTTYEFNGFIIPFLLCTGKTARQTDTLHVWRVLCDYDAPARKGDEIDLVPQAPAAPGTITPDVTVRSEVIPQVIYADIDSKPCLTPTGNFFETPFTTPLPITVLKIKQYETGWTDSNITSRTGRTNDATWRGEPAYSWRIDSISATPTTINGTDCHQTEYELRHTPLSWGWRDHRALIDTHYLKDVSGTMKKFPFIDKAGQLTTGWLNTDGTIRPRASGLVYDDWEPLEEIAYSFLANVPGA
ncbi:hypothetical protein [uncultured Maricaulis sp.]|uniref:hypothetical protein n=1 Tax=uncultured Maricaulis sp. TaxID=174710 RepID=UPI0030DB2C1B